MRAEIDLPNPGSQIRPGMYAYGKVVVERPDVRTIPRRAIVQAGGRSFVWRYVDGRARRTEVQTGVEDGEWMEVTNRHSESSDPDDEDAWIPIDGSERILSGPKLAILAEGDRVRVADATDSMEGEPPAKTSAIDAE
jgi:hypothetical protein